MEKKKVTIFGFCIIDSSFIYVSATVTVSVFVYWRRNYSGLDRLIMGVLGRDDTKGVRCLWPSFVEEMNCFVLRMSCGDTNTNERTSAVGMR